MLDKLKDFRETLSERIKSPFIGSYMISWSVIHWKVIILIISFDSDITYTLRVKELNEYIKENNLYSLFIKPALITVAVLVAFNILNSIGLIIKLLYDNWASPVIQKVLFNSKITTAEKLIKVKIQLSSLKKEYDDLNETVINANEEKKNLIAKLDSLQANSFSLSHVERISEILDNNTLWENYHIYPDKTTGSELFKVAKNMFIILENRTTLQITNIVHLKEIELLVFEKNTSASTVLKNVLVKRNDGSYFGVENGNIEIHYIPRSNIELKIKKATYGAEEILDDITSKVSELVNKSYIIHANNDSWDDPIPGHLKYLDLVYELNGKIYTEKIQENNSFHLIERITFKQK